MYLIVVHNCGRRSGGHHGEGVKDEIRSPFGGWICVVPVGEFEGTIGIGPLRTAKNSDYTIGIVCEVTSVPP